MRLHYFIMPYRLFAVGVVVSISFCAWAGGDGEAKRSLLDMIEAMGRLNYHGTVVYMRDGKIEPMKIFHSVTDGVEKERVVALNSPLREIIRESDKVTCYYPDSKKVVVEHNPVRSSFLLTLPNETDNLDASYRFELGGTEHIALKAAQIIHVIPKDDYRYGRKIWMDRASKLPLKFEVVGEDGRIIEQMTFISQQIEDTLSIKSLHAASDGSKFTWHFHDKETLSPNGLGFEFSRVPVGFRRVLYARRKMRSRRQPVEHILFSDGFSSVSIYIDRSSSRSGNDDRSVGATHVYTRQMDDYLITVMGEVPFKTVHTIAEGIVPRK